MATILYTWELGGGLGHVTRFSPLAKRLAENGHRVVTALRHVRLAKKIFGELECWAAPHMNWPSHDRIDLPCTFTQILHNVGWSSVEELSSLVDAWRSIIVATQPNLLICDHGPAAMLAARCEGIPYATIGTGFCAPVDESPLRNLRSWMKVELAKLIADEERILSNANAVLRDFGAAGLDRLSQLYSDADEQFLTTYPELDHYPNRPAGRFYGVWETEVTGNSFTWPKGNGPKVFCYLKDATGILETVTFLKSTGCPTVVFAPEIAAKLQPCVGPTLSVFNQPLDMNQVRRKCDVAILNATHATTASMLLSGNPVLSVPLTLEQVILAQRVQDLGAGLGVSPGQPTQFAAAFQGITRDKRFAQNAQAFAAKHANYDSQKAIAEVVQRIEELATGTGALSLNVLNESTIAGSIVQSVLQ